MYTTEIICPACDEGSLHDQIERTTVKHKNRTGLIFFEFSRCDYCKAETANARQTENNKIAMGEFKRNEITEKEQETEQ